MNAEQKQIIRSLIVAIPATFLFVWLVLLFFPTPSPAPHYSSVSQNSDTLLWVPPSIRTLGDSEQDQLIKYGRDLIANTALYLGPKGRVRHSSNGMNCQNCHLDAGTKIFGNNYSAVASTYPKYRERSGSIESIYKRVNDCIERSLNGTALDTASREMQAISGYIRWLGRDIPKGKKVAGAGITDLKYMPRSADTIHGHEVYLQKCQSCHMAGGGMIQPDQISYQYPPLWGEHSYNMGAGLYRLSRLAGYVKSNMPLGATYDRPQLSDEEAWDVAAYINSQPRPKKDLSHDWPTISGKPVDHPFGPFADSFADWQHKYGPFAPIAAYKKSHSKK